MVSSAQANWFTDFFKQNWDGDLSGQAYSANYAGYDKEKITCNFIGATAEETCYSRKGQCSDEETCSVNIGGETGEKLTWRSTCSDEYIITSIDGNNKEIEFNCAEKDTATITCSFEDATQEHTCSASIGSCTGLDECNFTAEAEPGTRIMFTSSCGDYGYLTFNEDNEVSFECGDIRTERDICDFGEGVYGYCHALDYPASVSCTGTGRCLTSITGPINDRVRWITDNNYYGYSLLDGTNEYITFSDESVESVKENITCQFADAGDYSCYSGLKGCSSNGEDSCKVEVEAEYGIQLTWTSNFPDSIPKITRQDGNDETILFDAAEKCLNQIDDDADGLVDCEDESCFGYIDEENGLECVAGEWLEYDCTDGVDNDNNTLADCADINRCKFNRLCVYPEYGLEGICSDGFDNDGDGDIDYDDSDCMEPSFVLTPTSGIAGSSFTLEGNSLGEEDEEAEVTFGWVSLESQVFVLDERGHFYYEGIVPEVETGDYSIRLVSPRLTRILTYRVEEGNPTTERITCNFPDDSIETYSCNYIVNEQMSELCRGSVSCSGILEDYELGDEFEWYSSGLVTEDSPTYFDGTDKEITFTNEVSGSPEIVYKENVTCIFDDGSETNFVEYSCSGYQDGQISETFTCSGYDRCVVEVKGDEEVNYVWTSTVPDTDEVVTLLDNIDETLRFISPVYIEASWICNDGFYIDSATSPVALTKALWLDDYIKPSCESHEGISSYSLVEDESEVSFVGQAFFSLFGSSDVTETFTCIFEGSDTEETCYSDEGRCTGVGRCSFEISAEEETIVSVRSSIVGSEPYSVLVDGVDEIGIFSVPAESISEEITCIFTQSQEVEQRCYSDKGECFGVNSCSVTIEGEEGEYVIWKSTVEGSADVETIILGSPKILEFVEVIEEVVEEITETEIVETTEIVSTESSGTEVVETETIPEETIEEDIVVIEEEAIVMEEELVEETQTETIESEEVVEETEAVQPQEEPAEVVETETSIEQVQEESVEEETTEVTEVESSTEIETIPEETTETEVTNPEISETEPSTEESTIPEQEEQIEPEPQQGEIEPEPMLTQYSWMCDDGYSVEYAYVSEELGEKSQSWWVNEARYSCESHGSTLQELTSELPLIGESVTTGNVVYQPKTYTGWLFYQLGLIG